jgi:hypothetical protein
MSDPRTLMQILEDCRERFIRGGVLAPRPENTSGGGDPPGRDGPVCNPTIPRAFRWATLDAPELRERVGREQAIAHGAAAIDSPGVLLEGPSGSGKTSLACALLRAWDARNPRRPGVFVPAWSLGVARMQYALGEGEPPLVERAMSTALLVLDDLGCERNTPTNAVPDVIFARALAQLPTWVTTWMTAEAIAERYGDGVARRVYESGRVEVIGCGGST